MVISCCRSGLAGPDSLGVNFIDYELAGALFSDFPRGDAMDASKGGPSAAEKNDKTGEKQSSASAAIEALTSQKPDTATAAADLTSDSILPLIQKIAAGSIAEIERMIGELQATRSFLESEGERIHQETVRFAQLNKTATASVKIISESISEWLESGRQGRSSKVAVQSG
jgi:hypothetical protein